MSSACHFRRDESGVWTPTHFHDNTVSRTVWVIQFVWFTWYCSYQIIYNSCPKSLNLKGMSIWRSYNKSKWCTYILLKEKNFIQPSSACLFMEVQTGNVFELTLCYCYFRYNRFHQVHQVNSWDLSPRLNANIEWSINLLYFWTDLRKGFIV